MPEALRMFTQPLESTLVPAAYESRPESVLLWAETIRNPELTAQLRHAILDGVYRGDYHQDVADMPRLTARIKDGTERVFFWGDREALSSLACRLGSGVAADTTAVERIATRLGTATFIDRSDWFGNGVFELSRTGSRSREEAADGANLAAIAAHWAEPATNADVIYCTPRNRASSPGIPGGMGIQRFHQRVARSAFLGFSPWHLMAGGVIEWLEFRSVLRDPPAIASRCECAPAPVVGGAAAAAVCDLILDGLGLTVRAVDADGPSPTSALPVDDVEFVGELRFLAVGEVRALLEKGGDNLATLVSQYSCVVARIPLDATTVDVQQHLAVKGFALTAVEFPPTERDPWIGHWLQPYVGLPPARPAYFRPSLPHPSERALMDIIDAQVEAWNGGVWAA
jgi:hypothetical protein